MAVSHRWTIRAFVVVAILIIVAPAEAAPPYREVTQDTFVVPLCGLDEVQIDIDFEETIHWTSKGRDRLPHYAANVRGEFVWTNLANGRSLRETFNVNDKDLKVTDNGDGTLTVLVLATGSDGFRDDSGRLVLSNPGQVRFEQLIDHGGTPFDPADDQFLADLGIVKNSTGRNDTEGLDFCSDIINAFIG